jgi:hypothetical protein
MSDTDQSLDIDQQLAMERSHQDARHSNEASRAAAQAVILINGGAATAILAYVSKETSSPMLLFPAAVALGGYGLGVVFGALMLFSRMKSVFWWMIQWERRALKFETPHIDRAAKRGMRWVSISNLSFGISILCFLSATLVMVMGLLGRLGGVSSAS